MVLRADPCVQSVVYVAIKSNFIALIPKCDRTDSFKEYRPITLCNLVYKVISKILSNRIKPKLAELIS